MIPPGAVAPPRRSPLSPAILAELDRQVAAAKARSERIAAEIERLPPPVAPFKVLGRPTFSPPPWAIKGVTAMPKLSAVVAEQAEVLVPIGAERVKVSFNPSKLTPRLVEGVMAGERTGSIDGALLGPLSELLIEWDLTTDDEEPLPTTPSALRDVPAVVLTHVLLAIVQHIAPHLRPPGNGRARP
jgi:hypothetical protein